MASGLRCRPPSTHHTPAHAHTDTRAHTHHRHRHRYRHRRRLRRRPRRTRTATVTLRRLSQLSEDSLFRLAPPTTTAKGGAVPCGLGSLSRRCAAPVSVSTQRLGDAVDCGSSRVRPCALLSHSRGAPRPKCVARRHAPANAITEATNDITILGRTSTRSSGKQKSAQPSLRAHAIAYLRGSER